MELLIILCVIVVLLIGPIRIIRWFSALAASSVAPDSELSAKLNPQSFIVSIDKDKAEFGGEAVDCFKIKIRGMIKAPCFNFSYQVAVHLMDVTDGTEKPVICAIEQLQEGASVAFEFRTDPLMLPYADTVIVEWLPVVTIPKDIITLARSGQRRLKCRLDIINASSPPLYIGGALVHSPSGSILATASRTIDVVMTEAGYEDLKDNRRTLTSLTIKLAMAISASDGVMDQSEGDVIRLWLTKHVAHLTEQAKLEEKKRLNNEVAVAFKAAKNKELDISELCGAVKKVATTADCYDILELCLHVAAADGEAHAAELNLTREIARLLGVSLDRLRSMEEKIVPISMHQVQQNAESILGIAPDMPPEQIRRHLNQEYRKWNSRSTHSDAAVRQQATEMLQIIAECRRKYVA